MFQRSFFAIIALSVLSSVCSAQTVHVAVAANFTQAMNQIVTQFESMSGHDVVVSLGSSGKLFAQIQHGAPFDVLLSADQEKPMALEQEGRTVPESRFTYAIGELALWSSNETLIDQSPAVLSQNTFHKLALANPKLAPYGAAAVEVLTKMALLETTQHKWVQGENITQAYQFVATGNAELGFVALSQIMQDGQIKKGSYWRVPSDWHSPIRQDAVLLDKGRTNPAALALLAFLKSTEGKEIIQSYGYQTE